MLKLDSYTKI